MGRETALALLLATACGSSGDETAGAGDTDTQASTTDTTDGNTAGAPSGGASESDTTVPTTSAGSNSGASDTDDTTTTTGTTDTTTTTGEPTTETGPDTTTTTTQDTTSDTTTTGDTTTMGVDDTGDTSTTGTSGPDTSSTSEPDTTTGDIPCGSVLKATIRDFAFAHPDFEDFGGNNAYTGLVEDDLGPDQKPVYAHPGPTPQTSGPDAFAQWYNDVPGVNHSFQVDLPLTEVMPGLYQFADNTFFPIDNLGFGNEGQPNNFAFTTEIHTTFAYSGGEVFTFIGDDDVWVFINGKLALDLGGLHPQLTDSIDLDASAAALGITPGDSYSMDIFHAERHTNESNFRIDTTIACFIPM